MRFDFDENLITEGRLADGLNLKYRFWENLKDVYGIVMKSIVYDDFDEFVNYLNEQIVKKSCNYTYGFILFKVEHII